MNRLIPMVLLASGLTACASQERAEPPAPVVSATTPAAESAPAAPAPQEGAEVYAYRPHASAPDAAAFPDSVPSENGLPADGSLITESATPGTTETTAGGKASGSPSGTPAVRSAPPAPGPVAYAPPPSAPSLAPAADALVRQAEQQRQARDYVGAAATLERALGIAPQEPHVWNRLARVRMEQGLYSQAGNLASRSNALSGDQVALKQDNWRIIAAARRAAGDNAGAMEAERKARGG